MSLGVLEGCLKILRGKPLTPNTRSAGHRAAAQLGEPPWRMPKVLWTPQGAIPGDATLSTLAQPRGGWGWGDGNGATGSCFYMRTSVIRPGGEPCQEWGHEEWETKDPRLQRPQPPGTPRALPLDEASTGEERRCQVITRGTGMRDELPLWGMALFFSGASGWESNNP